MKELNEYKAEIFRRSEEKIKERKRRTKRSIILCTTLCLFFAVSVILIPPMLTDNADGASVEQDQIMDDADGAEALDTAASVYIRVEVTSKDQAAAATHDTDKISQIEELITSCFDDNYLYYDISERKETAEIRDESHTDYSMSESINENDDEDADAITVTLTAADGYTKTLIINGHKLIDTELDVDTDITESRLGELIAIIGLE